METSNWAGSGFNDARLTLFSASGDELLEVDSNFQLEYTLPETGTFTLRITANNLVSTGSYNLGLEGIAPLSPGPTAIALGDVLSGSIDAAAESDFFTYAGTAGDIISLTLVETSSWAFAVDARLTLFSASGAELLEVDSNVQLEYTLPETGTFTLRITANNLVSTGSYNLGLQGS